MARTFVIAGNLRSAGRLIAELGEDYEGSRVYVVEGGRPFEGVRFGPDDRILVTHDWGEHPRALEIEETLWCALALQGIEWNDAVRDIP